MVGYHDPETATGGGSELFPVTPERHVDTLIGTGGIVGPVHNADSTSIGLAGTGSIPAIPSVTVVDANITVGSPLCRGPHDSMRGRAETRGVGA